MTVADLAAYFENYAVKHKQLLHDTADPSKATFFVMNTDKNINEYLRSNPLDLMMILLVPDKMLHKASENYTWFRHCAFMVLARVPDTTNANIVAGQNNCEVICNDFITRLIDDRQNRTLDSLDTQGFEMQPVGVLGDNHYGYMTMFRQVDEFVYEVDPDRWTI